MDIVKYKLVKQCHHPLIMKATIRLGIEGKIEQMLLPQVLNTVDQVLQVFDYAIHHKIAQEGTTLTDLQMEATRVGMKDEAPVIEGAEVAVLLQHQCQILQVL